MFHPYWGGHSRDRPAEGSAVGSAGPPRPQARISAAPITHLGIDLPDNLCYNGSMMPTQKSRQSLPPLRISLHPRKARLCRPLFSTTSALLHPQPLSFHSHTNTTGGEGTESCRPTNPSAGPPLRALESISCAIVRAKSHRMKILCKNRGGVGVGSPGCFDLVRGFNLVRPSLNVGAALQRVPNHRVLATTVMRQPRLQSPLGLTGRLRDAASPTRLQSRLPTTHTPPARNAPGTPEQNS
jgi:hypothetical protein